MTRGNALAAFVVVAPACAVIAAVALWIGGVAPSRTDLIVFAVGTAATMAGVELGFHRYFAHRSFTARPALVWVLGALGSSAFLGPVMWWVAMHRRHHAVTDREGDPHSPHWPSTGARGLVHAHVGWLFQPEHTLMSVSARDVKDMWQNPRTVALHRSYLIWGVLGLAIPTLIGFAAGGLRGALTGFLWGGMTRVFVVTNLVWAVNSLGHAFGGRAQLPHSGAHATACGWCYPRSAAAITPTTMTPRARTPLGRAGGRSMSAARCCGCWRSAGWPATSSNLG